MLILPRSAWCGRADVPCVPSVIVWCLVWQTSLEHFIGARHPSLGLERGGNCLVSSEAWLGLGQDGITLILSKT